MLHVRFEEEVEPPLDCDDLAGVVVAVARIANGETTGELVKPI